MKKQEKGITLIALVITIIVMLILTGVTISLLLDDDGIITKAKQVGVEQKNSELQEKANLAALSIKMDLMSSGNKFETEDNASDITGDSELTNTISDNRVIYNYLETHGYIPYGEENFIVEYNGEKYMLFLKMPLDQDNYVVDEITGDITTDASINCKDLADNEYIAKLTITLDDENEYFIIEDVEIKLNK